jgi:MFS family permease
LQILLFTIFLLLEEGSVSSVYQIIKKNICEDVRNTLKMGLPPVLLILSAEFLEIAINILPEEASRASSFYIAGVAVFSALILKKKFLLTQILAVFFIAIGLSNFPADTDFMMRSYSLVSNILENEIFGYASIVAAICCYGLAYSILEKNLKSSDVSLWIRGIQLNIFIVPLSLLICVANQQLNEAERGFFDNFNIIAWFFIIFVVALNMMDLFVIKVADSMFRMISLSIAIMIIGIMKYPFSLSSYSPVKLGTGLILAGAGLYSVIDIVQPNLSILEDDEEQVRDYNPRIVPMKLYQSVPTVSLQVKNNHNNSMQQIES